MNLTTRQVSERTKIPESTLRYMRHAGTGPKSFKLTARAVRYREEDVEQWIKERYEETVIGDDLDKESA
ncbi:helix-turn-helix domain-containing protein [Corynebacterium hindlerae]|nr:helix-turn-helix domain-containing protein [Corynebacterium hindlerae]QTH60087.1 helix-turn-helix domain-containing protein [Corynebacterium hindlerae]